MQLNEHPDVEWIRDDKPKKRVKRDYVVDDAPKNGRSIRQTLPRRALPIPKLPFPDPLYQDQWYLVSLIYCFYYTSDYCDVCRLDEQLADLT